MPGDIAENFQAGTWQFTPEVADVFDEHVRASVPFYDAIQELVAEASDWLAPAGGLIADLGASTGTTVAGILARHPERNLRAVLYDEQPTMLGRATARLADPVSDGRVTIRCRRIEDGPLDHADASLTLSLFTLQFLTWQARLHVLREAHKTALSTGALIVAEKVLPCDARWCEIAIDVSRDWKANHGISADAIQAKARALRGVLMPHTEGMLRAAIIDSGWHSPEVLFRWHQWIVIGAFASNH